MKKLRSHHFAEELIIEFENKGFVASFSNPYLLDKLRKRYNQYFKIFDGGCKISAGRLTKYGIYEIFGEKIKYYYDIRREDEFINFLVNRFYKQNPNAGPDIQSSFTRILHSHGLCWAGCVFHNSNIDIKKFKYTVKKKGQLPPP